MGFIFIYYKMKESRHCACGAQNLND